MTSKHSQGTRNGASTICLRSHARTSCNNAVTLKTQACRFTAVQCFKVFETRVTTSLWDCLHRLALTEEVGVVARAVTAALVRANRLHQWTCLGTTTRAVGAFKPIARSRLHRVRANQSVPSSKATLFRPLLAAADREARCAFFDR
jgi:hypothetical protein